MPRITLAASFLNEQDDAPMQTLMELQKEAYVLSVRYNYFLENFEYEVDLV